MLYLHSLWPLQSVKSAAVRVVFVISVCICAYYRPNSIAIQRKPYFWELLMSPPLLKTSVIREELLVPEKEEKKSSTKYFFEYSFVAKVLVRRDL